MNTHILQNWLSNHGIKMIDSQRRIYRSTTSQEFFRNPADYNTVDYREPCITTERAFLVEIPELELKKIIEFEDRVFGGRGYNSHHYNMFITMLEQKEQEARLRESNEAVKKAYEHYSLMLTLAKSKENN